MRGRAGEADKDEKKASQEQNYCAEAAAEEAAAAPFAFAAAPFVSNRCRMSLVYFMRLAKSGRAGAPRAASAASTSMQLVLLVRLLSV